MKKILKSAFLITSVLSLGACSIVPSQPDLAVYQLPANKNMQQAGNVAQTSYSLYIEKPYTDEYLDQSRIVVQTPKGDLSVYEGVRWNDRAPLVFRDSLVQAVRGSGMFSAVTNASVSGRTLKLKIFINKFQVEYRNGQAVVVMDVDANLNNDNSDKYNGTVSQHFVVEVPSEQEAIPKVVETFAVANAQLQQQIISWLGSQISR